MAAAEHDALVQQCLAFDNGGWNESPPLDVATRTIIGGSDGDDGQSGFMDAPYNLRNWFLGSLQFSPIWNPELSADQIDHNSPLQAIAMSTPLRGAVKPIAGEGSKDLLSKIVDAYNESFAGEFGPIQPQDVPQIYEELLQAELNAFNNALTKMATIENVPLTLVDGLIVGSLDLELDCRAEDHTEKPAAVAGIHTSYPRIWPNDRTVHHYHTSVVRRVRRWRFRLEKNKLKRADDMNLEICVHKLRDITKHVPRLVNGLSWHKFQNGKLVDSVHYKQYSLLGLTPNDDERTRKDAPYSGFAKTMSLRFFQSASTDCNLWKELRTRLRTKLASLIMVRQAAARAAERVYAPGGPGADDAARSFRGGQLRQRLDDEELSLRERGQALRALEEIQRDRGVPSPARQRSRDNNVRSSLAGGVPSLARLKL